MKKRVEKAIDFTEAPGLRLSSFSHYDINCMHLNWMASDATVHADLEPSEAYVLNLVRLALPARPGSVDGRGFTYAPVKAGQFMLYDTRVKISAVISDAVDSFIIYFTMATLRQFQSENRLPPSGLLNAKLDHVYEDIHIWNLCQVLFPFLGQPKLGSHLLVDHVLLALLSRLTELYGLAKATFSYARGGLSARQERRAKEMLLAHLDGDIGLEELAAECQLSRSHFARAFKVSTGMSPMRWLSERRVEHAKALLKQTDLPVAEIAVTCGFADAAHLHRVFSRATGMAPGSWRRMQRS